MVDLCAGGFGCTVCRKLDIRVYIYVVTRIAYKIFLLQPTNLKGEVVMWRKTTLWRGIIPTSGCKERSIYIFHKSDQAFINEKRLR